MPNTPRLRRAAVLVLVTMLAGSPPVQSAADPLILEDVVARGFEVAVSITPVDLSVEMVGGDLRFLSRGTLRGIARVALEITAGQPVSRVRMDLSSVLTDRALGTGRGRQGHLHKDGFATALDI